MCGCFNLRGEIGHFTQAQRTLGSRASVQCVNIAGRKQLINI